MCSTRYEGNRPGIDFHDTIIRAPRSTTASETNLAPPSYIVTNAHRGTSSAPSKVSVAVFAGSASWTITNFSVGVAYSEPVMIAAAASISAPLNGSKGYPATPLAPALTIVSSIVIALHRFRARVGLRQVQDGQMCQRVLLAQLRRRAAAEEVHDGTEHEHPDRDRAHPGHPETRCDVGKPRHRERVIDAGAGSHDADDRHQPHHWQTTGDAPEVFARIAIGVLLARDEQRDEEKEARDQPHDAQPALQIDGHLHHAGLRVQPNEDQRRQHALNEDGGHRVAGAWVEVREDAWQMLFQTRDEDEP